ncbi:MAG: winged helix-turn-helix transcriptional regulator [Acidimicrobiales bacterium]
MAKRSYRHQCSLAQALDVIGERWTLLVVHELLVGPHRYKDLLDALPGIGSKILAARLRTLEDAGVVTRRVLPPPAGSTVYELTESGEALRPAVASLFQWGSTLPSPTTGRGQASIHCGMFGIQHVLFQPDRARGVRETYEFRIDDEVYHLEVNDGRATTHVGPAPRADATFSMDADTFWDLGYGELAPTDALAAGRGAVSGDPEAAERCLEMLGLAPLAARPAPVAVTR